MLPDPSYDLTAGELVDGRFRVVEPLGMGGMGSVYRATELASGENVAIKLLHADVGSHDEARLRFEREARALAALQHPHIVSIRGFGIAGGTPYLVMEWVPGRTLTEIIVTESPLEPARALGLAGQILDAVAFIHEQGIIHRDLKSPNVLVAPRDDGSEHAWLLDFGFAKFFDKERWHDEETLTAKGAVFGTRQYMAPEQAIGSKVSAAADVYALGILLFELLTGLRPFRSDERQKLFEMHMTAPVPPMHELRADLHAPPELEGVIQRALAKEPGDRFPDAGAMKRALDAAPPPTVGAERPPEPASEPQAKSSKHVALVAALAIAGAALLAILVWART